jgi:hypothetical protein
MIDLYQILSDHVPSAKSHNEHHIKTTISLIKRSIMRTKDEHFQQDFESKSN